MDPLKRTNHQVRSTMAMLNETRYPYRVRTGVLAYRSWYVRHFSEERRSRVIFEKHIPLLRKGEPIESYMDDVVPFGTFFSGHCPPIRISEYHGIGFGISVRLAHPTFIDVTGGTLEEELPAYIAEREFQFEDFLEPISAGGGLGSRTI